MRETEWEERHSVEDYIGKLPAVQQEIALSLRALILKAAPTLQETVKWSYPCYVGTQKVCSIMPFKGHVNLAFFRGAELADPQDLLAGAGKAMRHVKVHNAKDIPTRPLTALLKAAARLV